MDRREIKARIVTEVHRSFHNETGLDAVFDGDIGIADRSGTRDLVERPAAAAEVDARAVLER